MYPKFNEAERKYKSVLDQTLRGEGLSRNSSALDTEQRGPSQVTVGSSNIDTEQSGPSEAQSCDKHRAERTSSAS